LVSNHSTFDIYLRICMQLYRSFVRGANRYASWVPAPTHHPLCTGDFDSS